VIDRRSAEVLTAHWSVFYSFLFKTVDYLFFGVSAPYIFAPPITSDRTPHASNHYSDTLKASIETTILMHNR